MSTSTKCLFCQPSQILVLEILHIAWHYWLISLCLPADALLAKIWWSTASSSFKHKGHTHLYCESEFVLWHQCTHDTGQFSRQHLHFLISHYLRIRGSGDVCGVHMDVVYSIFAYFIFPKTVWFSYYLWLLKYFK